MIMRRNFLIAMFVAVIAAMAFVSCDILGMDRRNRMYVQKKILLLRNI